MATIQISTCLDPDTFQAAKKTGLKWNQLLKLGINSALKRDSGEVEQIREDYEKLRNKHHEIAGRLLALEMEKEQKQTKDGA